MTIDPRAPTPAELLAHAGWLRSLALQLLRDPHAADDAVQETWLAVLRHPPRRGAGLRPWLRAVLVNAVRKRGRGDARRASHERDAGAPPVGETPDELVEHAELSAALLREVLALAPAQRDVVLRRYWRGRSAAEIARDRGVPAATVRSQLKRALDELRARMSGRLGGDAECDRALRGIVGLAAPWAAARTGGVGGALQGAWVVKESSRLAWIGGVAALALVGTWGALRVVREAPGAEPRAADAELAAAPPVAPSAAGEDAADEQRVEIVAPASEPTQVESRPAAAVPSEDALPLLRARVVDSLRAPVVDARVELLDVDPVASASTDDRGAVELRHEPPPERRFESPRTLRVHHRDHATQFLLVTLARAGETDLGEIELADGGSVAGRVVDSAGVPLADALVRVGSLPLVHPLEQSIAVTPDQARRLGPYVGLGLPEARTTADGRFRVDGVPAGVGRAWASVDDGRHAFSEPIDVCARAVVAGVEIVVGERRALDRIEGGVVGPDGEPVPLAEIHYTFMSSLRPLHAARADASGRFSIDVAYDEPHDLSVEDPTHERGSAVLRGVEPGTRGLVVRLPEPRWIEVVGRDEKGEPVDFAVDVRGTGHVVSVLDVREAGDEPGRVRVLAPPEPFRLAAVAEGYPSIVSGPFDPAAPPASLELTFESVPGVVGRVVADGAPVAGAAVTLHEDLTGISEVVRFGFRHRTDPYERARATTDAEGRFRLVVDAGSSLGSTTISSHRLLVEAAGYALGEWGPGAIDDEAGEEIEIELVGGGAIEGRVLVGADEDPGGRLVAISRGDGRIRKQRTEPDGSFRFDHVTPGGWQVRARALEARDSMRYGFASSVEIEPDCRVVDGRVTVHDIDLRDEARAQLVGRLAIDGEGAAGWSALLEHVYESEVVEPVRPVLLDEHGSFALVAPPGPYDLRLMEPDGAALTVHADVMLAAPETAWELAVETAELVPSGPANGGTSRRLRFQWHGDSVRAVAEVDVDESGSFPATRVPAGRIGVHRKEQHVFPSGFAADRLVRVLELDLEPGERRAIAVR